MTIDPADVLKNPEDYLLDGEPISRMELWVIPDTSGRCCRSGHPNSKSELDKWDRITRRPRTRTVKARRYWMGDKLVEWNATHDITKGDLEAMVAAYKYVWAGPESDVTVEE